MPIYGRARRLDAQAGLRASATIGTRLACCRPLSSMSTEDPHPPPRRSAGPLQIASAVFWSFFGVRKRRKLEDDATTIKPQHVVIAGIIGAALFVLVLIVIVRIIVANA